MATPTNPADAFNKYISVVADCIQTNMETSSALASASNSSNDGLVSLTQSWTTDSGNTPIAFISENLTVTPPAPTPVPIPIYNNPVAAALYGGYYFQGPGAYVPADSANLIIPGVTNPTLYPGLGWNANTDSPQGFLASPIYLPNNTPFIPNNNNTSNGPYGDYSPGGVSPGDVSLGQQGILNFIGAYFAPAAGNASYITDLSSSEVMSVMTTLQNNWEASASGTTNPSSVALGTCNAMNTLVSSSGTNDEQSLQTLCSTLTNMLGQSQNALQTIVSGGSTVNQMVGSLINAMAYY